ncbi:MAG: cytochrome o ubiquinol oxidase subunit IV [Porticoccaceae bacterium]|nr:cytochrome o ubiquinol oxidase subunit IV [Porticoccaceae bacterium]MDG1473552.1 cytochrome o ubiquinol oxidase subunit IV [Porticoccaceae bacterium]
MNTNDTHSPGGAAAGSLSEYLLGLSLSVILTAVPFAVVMSGTLGETLSIILILLCAIGQVMVQLVFFLHMNTSSQQMWNSVSGIFVVLLVVILIVGSLWIMQHLNHNMLMGH